MFQRDGANDGDFHADAVDAGVVGHVTAASACVQSGAVKGCDRLQVFAVVSANDAAGNGKNRVSGFCTVLAAVSMT